MTDVDLERAERLAAEFWTEPGDQQAARSLLVTLVARVRALTEAGNTLADVTYNLLSGSDRPTLDAALDAWRTLVAPSDGTVTRNDRGDVLLYHGGPFDGRPFSPLDPPTAHDESYAVRLSDRGMILGAWWDPPVNPPPYGVQVSDA